MSDRLALVVRPSDDPSLRMHLVPKLRASDPFVAHCSPCRGVLVLQADEIAPTCPSCGAPLCDDCTAICATTVQA